MSELVGNPEDRFSQNEAHIFSKLFNVNNIFFCKMRHLVCRKMCSMDFENCLKVKKVLPKINFEQGFSV